MGPVRTLVPTIMRIACAAALAAGHLAIMLAALVIAPPEAGAQIRDDRYPFLEERYRRQQQERQQRREEFSDPFSIFERRRPAPRPSRRPPPRQAESLKPPPPSPRKTDTPPTTTIMVIGDGMADWLAYGLEEALVETPEIGVLRKNHANSGLIHNEGRNESFDWIKAVKDFTAAERADYVVVMLGLADRQTIRERAPAPRPAAPPAAASPGAPTDISPTPAPAAEPAKPAPLVSLEFRDDKWAEAYGRRMDALIAALRSKGMTVIWVGLPPVRGARAKADALYLNDIYRSHAEKAGVPYVDIWDGFADENGDFVQYGPDHNGQNRRLRTSDGVNFTKYGARKIALYVEREIRRLMRTTPVALPAPEQSPQTPAKPGEPAPRPVAGPVVPLTAAPRGAQQLMGAVPGRPGNAVDPVAAQVLVRGEPLAAPPGRADNFAWPRPGSAAEENVPPVTTPSAATTAPVRKKGPPVPAGRKKRPGQAAAAPAQPAR